MSERVEIVIDARDNASSAFGSVNKAAGSMQATMQTATGHVSGLGSTLEAMAHRAASGAPILDALSHSAKGLGGSLLDVVKIGAGVALGNIFAGLSMGLAEHVERAVTSITTLGQEVLRLQRETGATAEQTSGLLAVFERYGVEVSTASRSLGIFSKHIAGIEDLTEGAIIGGKGFAGTMQELGLKFLDTSGHARPMYDVLLEVADQFQSMPDGVEKTAKALELFGRGGKDMILVLNQGRDGMLEAMETAKHLGLVLSEDNVQAVRQFGLAQKDLHEATSGLALQLGVTFMPLLVKLAQTGAMLAEAFNEHVLPAIKDLGSRVAELAEKAGLAEWAGRIGGAISLVIEGLGVLAGGFADALGGILSIVTSVGQAIYEALQWLNPFASHSPPLVQQVAEGLGAIKEEFESVVDIREPLEQAGRTIMNFGSTAKEVKESIAGLKDQLSTARDKLADLRDEAGETRDKVSGLRDALNKVKDSISGLSSVQIKGTEEFKRRLFDLEVQIDKASLHLHQLKLSGASKDSIKGAENALEDLRLKADTVRLQEKVTLEPLRRQAEQLKGIKPEMTIGEIAAAYDKYRKEQAEINTELDDSEALYRDQTAAIKDQEGVIKTVERNMRAAEGALKDFGEAAGKAGGGAAGLAGAVGGIKENLKGLDLTSVKQQLADFKQGFEDTKNAIREKVDAIKSFFQGLKDSMERLFSGQVNLADVLVFEPAKVSLQIVAKLGTVDWAAAWKTITDSLGNIGEWVEDQLNKVDMAKLGKSISNRLASVAVPKFKINLLGMEFSDETIRAALKDLSKAIEDATKDMKLGSTFRTEGKAAQSAIADLVGYIQANWQPTMDAMGAAMQRVGDVLGQIGEQVVPKVKQMAEAVIAWWQSIEPVVVKVLSGLLAKAQEIINGIAAVFSWFQSEPGQQHMDWWTALSQFIGGVWDIIQGIVQIALALLGGTIKLALAGITGDQQLAWQAIKEIVSGAWEGIQKILEGALKIFLTAMGLNYDEVMASTRTTFENVKNTIGDLLNGPSGAIKDIGKFATDVVTWLGKLATDALKAASEIGDAIITGIWNGIKAGWDWLKQQVSNLAKSLFEAAKAAIGMKSPSRLFMEVGLSIAEGIAEGIKLGTPAVHSALRAAVAGDTGGGGEPARWDPSDVLRSTVGGIVQQAWWWKGVNLEDLKKRAKKVNMPEWAAMLFMKETGKGPEDTAAVMAWIKQHGWGDPATGKWAWPTTPPTVTTTPKESALEALSGLGALGGDVAKALSSTASAFESAMNRILKTFDVGILQRAGEAAKGLMTAVTSLFTENRWVGLSRLGQTVVNTLRDMQGQFEGLTSKLNVVNQIKELVSGFEEMGVALSSDQSSSLLAIADALGGPFADMIKKYLEMSPERAALKGVKSFLEEFQLGQQLASAAEEMLKMGLHIPQSLLDMLAKVPRAAGSYLDEVIKQILAAATTYQLGTDYVPRTGLALVHQGEAIIPAGQAAERLRSEVHHHYNLTIQSNATTEQVCSDFAIMRSMAGA